MISDYLLLLVLDHIGKNTVNGEGHHYCWLLFSPSVMPDVVQQAYTAQRMFILLSKQKEKREKLFSLA